MIKRKRKVIMLGTICISIAVMICVYFILMFTGVINSNVNTLEITSSSESIEYNGEELSSHNYEITKGSLHKGHTIDIKFLKSITNVGQIANEVSVSILDSNNYDVTDEYELKINPGVLSVSKREITISTSSASKAYDGKELSSDDWYITKGNVLKNHTVNVNVYGSITEIGETPNICQAAIYNEQGQDVTTNYGITFDYGTLTIERKTIKFFSSNVKKTFDGNPYTPDTSKDFTFEGRLLNSSHKIVYEADPTIINVGTQQYMFNATIIDEYGNDVTSDYEVSYEYGKIEIESQYICLRTGSINKIYDGKEVLSEEFEITNNVRLIDGYEIKCEDFKSYVDAGSYTNSCNYEVLYEGHKTSNYIIKEESVQFGLIVINPIELKISCENYIKEYDDEYCVIPDLIYNEALLIDGDNIVYEKVDFNYKNAGTHALTEDDYKDFDIINIDNKSNLNNYDIQYELGNIIINKKKIVVDMGIEDLTYDGKSHGWEEINFQVANLDEDKFSIEFEFDNVSNITNVGSLDLTPLSVYIYRNNNELSNESIKDLSSNFDISYNNYILNIKQRNIVVTTKSAEKYYDGEILTFKEDPDGFSITSGYLLENHSGSHNRCTSEIKEEGEKNNLIDFTIRDINTQENVTNNYNIEYQYGTLKVRKINVSISLIDHEKIYDDENYFEPGTEISSSDYIKTVSYSDSNHIFKLIYRGLNNKEVGTYLITKDDIYLQVIEKQGNQEIDITSAYNIEFKKGCKIIINRRVVSIATGSKTAILQKEPLQYTSFSNSGTLLENHKLIGEFVSLEGIGTIENKAIFLVEDSFGNDVTSNYLFHYSYGTLTVKASPGAEDKYGYGIAPKFLAYKYDGITTVDDYVNQYNQDLEDGKAELSGIDQLVNEHGLTYKATVIAKENGDSTDIGKYTLEIDSFKLYYGEYEVTDSYKITYKTNTLQIYKYILDVSTNSIDVDTYDGRILNSELTHSGLEPGHYIYIESVPFINNVGNISTNEVKFIIKDGNGLYANDITDSYLLNVSYGTLSIKAAKTITLDLSDGSLIDIYGDDTVTYNLSDLIYYVDGIYNEDKFEMLELTYTPASGTTPAESTLNYEIYKEIDGVKYNVTNLYSIYIIFPED